MQSSVIFFIKLKRQCNDASLSSWASLKILGVFIKKIGIIKNFNKQLTFAQQKNNLAQWLLPEKMVLMKIIDSTLPLQEYFAIIVNVIYEFTTNFLLLQYI